MRKKSSHYSRHFKLKVIEEVLSGRMSKQEAEREFNIYGKGLVLLWMRKFGLASLKNLPENFEAMKEKPIKEAETAALYQRIKQLEQALDDAELKAEILSRMIDKAEGQLNIKIRKKPSTKQS